MIFTLKSILIISAFLIAQDSLAQTFRVDGEKVPIKKTVKDYRKAMKPVETIVITKESTESTFLESKSKKTGAELLVKMGCAWNKIEVTDKNRYNTFIEAVFDGKIACSVLERCIAQAASQKLPIEVMISIKDAELGDRVADKVIDVNIPKEIKSCLEEGVPADSKQVPAGGVN